MSDGLIFALDPGPQETAWCSFSKDGSHLEAGIRPNAEIIEALTFRPRRWDVLAVEWIECMGMAVGREVFDTCVFTGRCLQAFGGPWMRVPRREVKLYVCGDTRAKDPNIRQALLDRLGPQGTKRAPGPTYGFKSHCWAAAAVAVTASAALWGKDGPTLHVETSE